jgi:hypothetical protein
VKEVIDEAIAFILKEVKRRLLREVGVTKQPIIASAKRWLTLLKRGIDQGGLCEVWLLSPEIGNLCY